MRSSSRCAAASPARHARASSRSESCMRAHATVSVLRMDHLGEQRILDLIGGALVEPVASDVHEHLDRCDECRRIVATAMRGDATDVDAPTLGVGTGAPHGDTTTAAESPQPRHSRALPSNIGEYRLIEQIGRGGMGTVYRAHDSLLDREVAIKLIAKSASESARQRFLVEARAVARIRHPNVVVV